MARDTLHIVDPHHHLWSHRYNRYPWLQKERHVFVGDHSSIKRDYLLEDYLNDVAQIPTDHIHSPIRLKLVASVHIEAAAEHSLNEVLWIQHLSDTQRLRTGQAGFPQAIAASIDFTLPEDELRSLLTEYTTRFPNVRGVRQILNFHPTRPEFQLVPNEYLSNSQWRRGLSLLSHFNLHFELHVFATQIPLAIEIVEQHPDIQFILNHTGMCFERTSNAFVTWEREMKRLAEYPNVSVKISGLVMFDHHWTKQSLAPFVVKTIEFFGVERCMFASNFPVDKVCCASWQTLMYTYLDIVSDARYSFDHIRQLFQLNAQRFYKL